MFRVERLPKLFDNIGAHSSHRQPRCDRPLKSRHNKQIPKLPLSFVVVAEAAGMNGTPVNTSPTRRSLDHSGSPKSTDKERTTSNSVTSKNSTTLEASTCGAKSSTSEGPPFKTGGNSIKCSAPGTTSTLVSPISTRSAPLKSLANSTPLKRSESAKSKKSKNDQRSWQTLSLHKEETTNARGACVEYSRDSVLSELVEEVVPDKTIGTRSTSPRVPNEGVVPDKTIGTRSTSPRVPNEGVVPDKTIGTRSTSPRVPNEGVVPDKTIGTRSTSPRVPKPSTTLSPSTDTEKELGLIAHSKRKHKDLDAIHFQPHSSFRVSVYQDELAHQPSSDDFLDEIVNELAHDLSDTENSNNANWDCDAMDEPPPVNTEEGIKEFLYSPSALMTIEILEAKRRKFFKKFHHVS